jgi:hypothetical protein
LCPYCNEAGMSLLFKSEKAKHLQHNRLPYIYVKERTVYLLGTAAGKVFNLSRCVKLFFAVMHTFNILLHCLLLQIPSDYPPVRSKEVPEQMQPYMTWLIILGGLLFLFLFAVYLFRLDKKIRRWFER